jgi:hypothetical protein
VSKYITCNYQGRLGNLMYEIAATLCAAWENKMTPCFPVNYDWYYRDIQAFKEYIVPIVNNFYKYKSDSIWFTEYHESADFEYKPIVVTENTKLYGYFTTSLYFDKYRDRIIDLFSTNQSEVDAIYQSIKTQYEGRQLVSLHVRRTDYVTDYGDQLPIEFYRKAVQHFDNPVYIIFSDELDWCRENLIFLKDTHYVDEKDYISLLLMGRFDAHICANSTFSAMGIILGDRKKNKKVIAPKVWVNKTYNQDIQEKHWVLI